MPHEAAPAVERVGAAHVARHSRCEGDGEGTRRFERGRSKHKIFFFPETSGEDGSLIQRGAAGRVRSIGCTTDRMTISLRGRQRLGWARCDDRTTLVFLLTWIGSLYGELRCKKLLVHYSLSLSNLYSSFLTWLLYTYRHAILLPIEY
jgi:hypothetical protein